MEKRLDEIEGIESLGREIFRKFLDRTFVIKEKNVCLCPENCLCKSVFRQNICEKMGKKLFNILFA